jgi:hypothetical protein
MRMKNSTFYALLWFVAAFLIVSIASCSTASKGYDYKTHHRKSENAKPSKCYKKNNKW